MPQRWRPVIVLALLTLAACGGGQPELATIEPIRGKRTAEGNIAGEIVPLAASQGPADTLLGTTWEGEGLDGAITFEFLPDGVLRYTTAENSYTNGTWQQAGHLVSFEMNGRFAEWSGRIAASRMTGSAQNGAGRRWNWQATRR
jgi:hypothetical protein